MRLEGWHILIVLLIVAVVVTAVVTVLAVSRASAKSAKARIGVTAGAQPIGHSHSAEPIYQAQSSGTNIFAILALIFGIFVGILGIIFGHVARAQIKQTGQGGAGMALAGLILGYVWLALVVLSMFIRA